MAGEPQTTEEKAVRMYNKPAWLSKLLGRRNRNEADSEQEAERPQTPAEKGQRSHKGPALLTKLLLRRNRYDETEADE